MTAESASALKVDWFRAEPDEIKAEIARTRAHMDEHLSQLGRKLKPRVNVSRLQIPFAAAFMALAGALLTRRFLFRSRRRTWMGMPVTDSRKPRSGIKADRFRVRSAVGALDNIRALQLAYAVARKGKPAVYIVEPRKG